MKITALKPILAAGGQVVRSYGAYHPDGGGADS